MSGARSNGIQDDAAKWVVDMSEPPPSFRGALHQLQL